MKRTVRLVLPVLCLFILYCSIAYGGKRAKDRQSQPRLNITTNYTTSEGKVLQCVVTAKYYWDTAPGALSDDLVTVYWDPSKFTFDLAAGYEAVNAVCNVADGRSYSFNFQSTPKTATLGGIGFEAKLRNPDIAPKITSHPNGYAVMCFVPHTTVYVSDLDEWDFAIEYRHNSW